MDSSDIPLDVEEEKCCSRQVLSTDCVVMDISDNSGMFGRRNVVKDKSSALTVSLWPVVTNSWMFGRRIVANDKSSALAVSQWTAVTDSKMFRRRNVVKDKA